ncbi:tetratricopeptide repeat protein [Massilia sp. 2TAF26]|uniref:tetratricopeptide repeat protein n=1 Tax=Massilia sp. 2TAF26 TaxID=3233012 RepID=UPI003F9CCC30
MSLINKMLQDLDSRGTPGAESLPFQIRPVARERQRLGERVDGRTLRLAALGTGATVLIALASWYGWTQVQANRSGVKPTVVAAVPAPETRVTSVPVVAPVAGVPAAVSAAPAPAVAVRHDDRFDAAPAAGVHPKSVDGYAPDSDEARAARQAIMAELQARMTAGTPSPLARARAATHEAKPKDKARARTEARREDKSPAPSRAAESAADTARDKRSAGQGRQESGVQRAEGEYRHALNALQDGRMTEAFAALEQALKLDPNHDAARQTLVGLLIEARRTDEAIRHLQAGLILDPRQPALAMLLARLQIERGASGIDTLTRTLPYAGNNADYHAFLAGALQREQRYREAAEQYQAALRTAPANGVWWMGLGMSLQADKRNAEALEAFQRARASGTLSAELQAFVERRLQQLGR